MRKLIKTVQLSILLSFGAFYTSCSQSERKIDYKQYKLFDRYEISLPSNLYQENDYLWKSSENESSNMIIYAQIEIFNSNSLEYIIDSIENSFNKQQGDFQQKVTMKESLELNGKRTLRKTFMKDVNKGVFPVLFYNNYIGIEENESLKYIIRILVSPNEQKEITDSIFKSIKPIKQ